MYNIKIRVYLYISTENIIKERYKMIKATFIKNTRFTKLHLSSTNHNNTMELTKYSNTWQGKYSNNGQRINKDSYQAVLDHLVKKGW